VMSIRRISSFLAPTLATLATLALATLSTLGTGTGAGKAIDEIHGHGHVTTTATDAAALATFALTGFTGFRSRTRRRTRNAYRRSC